MTEQGQKLQNKISDQRKEIKQLRESNYNLNKKHIQEIENLNKKIGSLIGKFDLIVKEKETEILKLKKVQDSFIYKIYSWFAR